MNRITLFFSYSHEDGGGENEHVKQFKMVLEQLKSFNLEYFYDGNLNPGDHISKKIRKMMEQADFFVFLVSPDWLTSDSCRQEWELAKELCAKDDNKKRVSVILRHCAWTEFDDMGTILAIPTDGKPVTHFEDRDTAWKDVLDSLKRVINELRTNYEAKPEFIGNIRDQEFFTQGKETLVLDDLFVFPTLSSFDEKGEVYSIDSEDGILKNRNVLVVGDELSGKTALCCRLLLHLLEREKRVLYVDLQEVQSRKPTDKLYSDIFSRSFCGEFELWVKTLAKQLFWTT